jgi:dTDP-glucose 4,6-dehydratase
MLENLLVTGGSGFMGSAFIRFVLSQPDFTGTVVNLDLLTYAANKENLASVERDVRYQFIRGDIRDRGLLRKVYEEVGIDGIVHFAAETHVDRSISAPAPFIETNIVGTYTLLEFVRDYRSIRFHHISTDEVFGTLGEEGVFSEESPYHPRSPYSASKASSDHFVRAYGETYGLSVTLSHSTNNYGPYQFPEKFIPLMILNCLEEKPLFVYGTGKNIRDWLYVEDHARAIWNILNHGKRGEAYNVGSKTEMRNLDLLKRIIEMIAEKTGKEISRLFDLITFVPDRPGHDYRYALDTQKIVAEIGWKPVTSLQEGLDKTIDWYLANPDWVKRVQSQEYSDWIKRQYPQMEGSMK